MRLELTKFCSSVHHTFVCRRPIYILPHSPTNCVPFVRLFRYSEPSVCSYSSGAANGWVARTIHPYLKPRSRDYIANREAAAVAAAAAAAEAFHSLFLKPVPRAWTVVYERMDMPKHVTHLEEIGLF